MAAGAFAVEIDVQLSQDIQPVVVHDPVLDPAIYCLPAGCGHGRIFGMSLEAIQTVTFGTLPSGASAHIPSLRELLTAPGIDPAKITIELKSDADHDGLWQPDPESYVEAFLDLCDALKLRPLRIQSFDPRLLELLRSKRHDWSLYLLCEAIGPHEIERLTRWMREAPESDYGICAEHSFLHPDRVDACASAGIKLSVYTVNSLEDLHRMHGMGVRDIISDDPQAFIAEAIAQNWL